MTLTINPEMITLARESRRLTQSELAMRLGIAQGKISKIEAGLLPVTEAGLERLCAALNFPEDFFLQQERRFGSGVSDYYHRKKTALGIKTLDGIHADIERQRIGLARLLRAASIKPVRPFPHMDIDEYDGDAKAIARAVRSMWLLPRGPFKNLTLAIEEAGGVIFSCDFKTTHIDGVSRLLPRLPPMFFMNSANLLGDRYRFTLAHELGHLVMHSAPNPDMERQANLFAAELLMPEDDIKQDLRVVSIPRLANLKQIWKVAMSALLKRASDLGQITERQARFIWMKMGKAGYRTREPAELDIPIEQPTILADIVRFHYDLGYDSSGLARLMLSDQSDLGLFCIKSEQSEPRRLRIV